MDYEIRMATEADREQLLTLYKCQHGREYCPWEEDYPSNATIDVDLSKDNLFVMEKDGEIIAAISVDEDEEVDELPYWNKELYPEGELARLAVLPEHQNKGYARIMLQFGMDELKRRGCLGIHILVNKYNVKALRSYAVFGFAQVGECHMFGQDFLCYEKAF